MLLFNRETVNFEGNWLFTGPSEIPHPDSRILHNMIQQRDDTDSEIDHIVRTRSVQRNYGAAGNHHETLGTLGGADKDHVPPTGITTTGNYTAGTVSTYATRTGTADRFYEAIEEEEDDEIQDNV